jgi:hypothetical protein
MRFAVVTPDPAPWMHVRAFDEVAEAVHQGLIDLGHASRRLSGGLDADSLNIVFGAHHLAASTSLPADTVLFNLEQIVPGSLWLTPAYVAALRRYRVWDYSARNVAALRGLGVQRATHVPIGHARSLERISAQPEDIDVLFYGRLIPRRTLLLERIAARGLRVVALNDAYGERRDAKMARAKVILNVHVGEDARLEAARCFYAMINGRFVLSEDSADAAESGLAEGLAFAAYGGLEERCAWYVSNASERATIARRGQELIRARPQAAFLRPVLKDMGLPAV